MGEDKKVGQDGCVEGRVSVGAPGGAEVASREEQRVRYKVGGSTLRFGREGLSRAKA